MNNKLDSILDKTMPFASESKPDDKFNSLYQAWQQNDTPQTRYELLRQVQPVIDRGVHSYGGAKPSPNTRAKAKTLALQAFRTYDPARGNINNHILANLRRLQRTSAQEQNIINIPERISTDKLSLQRAEDELADRLGRLPSDVEISDKTGLSLKRIEYIRKARPGINSGQLVDESGSPVSPGVALPNQTNDEDIYIQLVYNDLNNIDKTVMEMTLGLHGAPKLSTHAIAKKLGISASAVSQRKLKIDNYLNKIRKLKVM